MINNVQKDMMTMLHQIEYINKALEIILKGSYKSSRVRNTITVIKKIHYREPTVDLNY